MTPWHTPDTFHIQGCILLLLFLQAGRCSIYPNFDQNFLDLKCSDFDSECVCGWNGPYSKLEQKYPKKLRQTKPRVPTSGRGSTLGELKRVVGCKTKEDIMEEIKAKRMKHSQSA